MNCSNCGAEISGADSCWKCLSPVPPQSIEEQPSRVRAPIAQGLNDQVELLENHVRLSRKGALGFLTHGFKGNKEILISQISSVQFKNAGALTNGYVEFGFLGGTEAKGGLMQATQDENTVMFNKHQQNDFERIKQAIDRKIAVG